MIKLSSFQFGPSFSILCLWDYLLLCYNTCTNRRYTCWWGIASWPAVGFIVYQLISVQHFQCLILHISLGEVAFTPDVPIKKNFFFSQRNFWFTHSWTLSGDSLQWTTMNMTCHQKSTRKKHGEIFLCSYYPNSRSVSFEKDRKHWSHTSKIQLLNNKWISQKTS